MRQVIRASVLSLAIAGFGFLPSGAYGQLAKPATQPTTTGQADVPVKVVVLFSSGVGYFEHEGNVTGNGFTELHFKTQQINDILKSLVLEDLGKGQVSAVVYPSQDPISKTLKSFQVDITANPSLAELLNQLRGAKVKLAVGSEQLEGTILGVEKKTKHSEEKEKEKSESWTLNLISGASIRAIALDTITKLDLESPELQEELHKALAALSQARDQDKKPVRIGFNGEGERPVKIGYVVESPVWKTSYRLVFTGKDKSSMQGWAIVENQTDNDWNNVQLSLVSGRPISFIEELYQPLYIPRPMVYPQLYASLSPQTYAEGMDAKKDEKAAEQLDRAEALADKPSAGAAAAKGLANAEQARSERRQYAGQDSLRELQQKRAALDPGNSVTSVASAAKLGELFEYTVPVVSLPRQRSAMIPILSEPVEVERLSIYRSSVLARNPLTGARIKNTTGKHLLQGPVTVFDNSSYAGDAQIDDVPPGQERLISYGVDLQMLVDATKNHEDAAIVTGSISKGVLSVTYKHVATQDYVAENKADHDKALIVEHPRRQNWKLVTPEKALETTDALLRFKESVPKGEKKTLSVKEEKIDQQTVAILPGDFGQLEFYSKTGAIPKSVKDALVDAIKRKRALVEVQRQLDQAKGQKAQVVADESRTRQNMETLGKAGNPQNDPSYIREKKKLDADEDAIDKYDEQIKTLTEKVNAQQKDLEDYLGKLDVEEK